MVELEQVEQGRQRLVDAARVLGLSYRQAKRIWSRYQEAGAEGLVHRGRGRPSNRGKPSKMHRRCLQLYQERYEGFGPTLAAEKLAQDDLLVDHETLRRWLLSAGLWSVRRKRSKHRRRRPRKQHFGEMVQMDGSHHDWFSRDEKDCLMGMIDDATNQRLSRLEDEETTADAMLCLWRWVETYGIPESLYVDRKSVFATDREPTIEEQLAGEEPLTAFGKACRTLGIRLIFAHSPQAKGRVERSHGVYQDRLVKEIRLQGLETYEQVNTLLPAFDEDLNRRFAVEPAAQEDHHRPLPPDLDLADVFVWEQTRTVQNDWTVRYRNGWYQITGPRRTLPPAKGKVTVRRRLDGSLQILYRDRAVEFEALPGQPEKKPKEQTTNPRPAKPPWRPADDHPWRRPWKGPSMEAR